MMDLDVGVAILAGLVLLLLFCVFRLKRNSSPQRIPGLQSKGPGVGNLPDLAECGTFQLFLTKHHHAFGAIFSFWYGDLHAVSLADPKYVKAVAHLHAHHPVQTAALEIFLTKKSMAGVDLSEWKRRRRQYWDQAFSPKSISQRQTHFEQLLSEHCLSDWVHRSNSQTPLECRPFFLKLAIKALYLFALGDNLTEDIVEKIYAPTIDLWALLEKKIHGTATTEEQAQFDGCCRGIRSVVTTIIERRKLETHSEQKFIDYVLADSDPEVVYSDVAAALLGGIHATSILLVWSVYYLARYPEQQGYIRQEVGEGDGVASADRARDSEALSNFIDEVLRVSLLTTFVQRINDGAPIHLADGYVIPTGTLVYLNAESMLWSSVFYRNPAEFNPNRFKDPGSRAQTQFFPFSFPGGRSCPGKWLALQEVSVILATLLRNFHIDFHSSQVLPVETVASFFNHPKQGIFVVLRKT